MADERPRQMRAPVKKTAVPEATDSIYGMFKDAVSKAVGSSGQDKGDYEDVDKLYKNAKRRGKMPGQ